VIPRRALRIGVDVRALRHPPTRHRGIGRYLCNQLRCLLAQAPDCEFVLYGDDAVWNQDFLPAFLAHKNCRYSPFHPSFPHELDLFHLTDPLPLIPKVPLLPFPSGDLTLIATIYDLIPLAFREVYLDDRSSLAREYEEKLAFLKEHCAGFLTISNFVAQDVQRQLGLEAERIRPIMGGLDPIFLDISDERTVEALRKKYDLRTGYFIYSGGIDFRKNIGTLLRAFLHALEKSKRSYELVFVGEFNRELLKEFSKHLPRADIFSKIRPLGYVSDEEMKGLLRGATAMVLPSLYEGFGLPALEAMACGTPVIASNRAALPEIVGPSGILVEPTDVQGIAEAMVRLASEPALRQSLSEESFRRAREFRWESVADKTLQSYQEAAPARRPTTPKARRLRVLLQNRSNAFSHPGGDTGVMNGLHDGLTALDVEVSASAKPCDLAGIDLVHLVNLTILPASHIFAQNALRQNVPYVVTTLYEDWPLFLEKSRQTLPLFAEYMESGYDDELFQRRLTALRQIPSGKRLENAFVARGAQALLASGEREAARLRRDFPEAAERVHAVPFGIRVLDNFGAEFKQRLQEKLGTGPFVLCVGRLETRKNQLMLMKALEDEELTLVFVNGGFTYQPPYENLCRNFRRRGRNIITGYVPELQLAAFYTAALCHVLPSWYELPGLVSVEAAAYGCPVAASTWGGVEDYLPSDRFFPCQPDDPVSIRNAVFQAIESKPNPDTTDLARRFTWLHSAERTLEIYENILTARVPAQRTRYRYHSSYAESDTEKDPSMIKRSPTTPYAFDCSIILSVQNGAEDTERCLEAISAEASAPTYEVIIVDNASMDRTPQLLAAVEGDIQILRQAVPLPRAQAFNLAAQKARGKFLVFLDSATEPQTGWLKHLLESAQEDDTVGCVGGKLVRPDHTIEHIGFLFREDRVPFSAYRGFPTQAPVADRRREFQAVSAGCLLVRRDIFERLGGFQENLPEAEDIDYCLRVRDAKGKILFCPNAVIYYHGKTPLDNLASDTDGLSKYLSKWAGKVQWDEEKVLASDGFRLLWPEIGQPRYLKSDEYEQELLQQVRSHRKAGEPEMAWNNLQKLLHSETVGTEAIGELAELASELQRAEEAERTLADLPQSPSILLARAQIHYHLQKYEMALEHLKEVLVRPDGLSDKERFEAWQLRGNCSTRLGRTEEAEKSYLQALLQNPSSERPYLGLGSAALTAQNWQAAHYGFAIAAAHNSENAKAHFGLGLALSERGMVSAAAQEFLEVLQKEPDHVEALFNLYKLAMETERPELVEIPLKTYLEKHPEDVDFLFHLCGLQFKMGQTATAANTCRRLLGLKPDHVAAQEVLAKLEKRT
ncbi:MAG: glycosyltransferase, partial [Calditrichaeota bacterium]|nr:glycosyltransferase [Calditrichota bacterium]